MKTKKQVNSILLRCKGGVHGKSNKAKRQQEKVLLKQGRVIADR